MADPLHINSDLALTVQEELPTRLKILPYENNTYHLHSDLFVSIDDSQSNDAAKNTAINIAANTGTVDPNPFNVLASLFNFQSPFEEAMSIVNAKISIFSALARDWIIAAAKHGDRGAAEAGRTVLAQAPGLPNFSDANSDKVFDMEEINFTDGDVEGALGTAEKVVKDKNRKENIKREIFVLSDKIPNVKKLSLKQKFENEKTGLKNLFNV